MHLVFFDAVSLAFGGQPLLREADFAIESGERVCLIGRNGVGKTSMLKLITGELEPDHGEVRRPADILTSQLEQALPLEEDCTVTSFVQRGLSSIQSLCEEYERRSELDLDASGLRELEKLHAQAAKLRMCPTRLMIGPARSVPIANPKKNAEVSRPIISLG